MRALAFVHDAAAGDDLGGLIVFRVAGHTRSGIVGGIREGVGPFGVIGQCVISYTGMRVT